MVCKVCGAENKRGAEYCDVCGAPLESAEKSRSGGLAHPWLLATAAAVLGGCIYGVGFALYLL